MPIDALDPDEVLALRFDEPAVAPELAAWCGGRVEVTTDEAGTARTTVWVPTAKGPRPAVLGDWVVRRAPDDHTVLDPTAFAATHGPAEP